MTAATRLHELGVDEQMVMERTGHRSLEGVRSYKRPTSQQQQVLSDILSSNIPERTTNQQQLQMPPHHQQLHDASSTHPSNLQLSQVVLKKKKINALRARVSICRCPIP